MSNDPTPALPKGEGVVICEKLLIMRMFCDQTFFYLQNKILLLLFFFTFQLAGLLRYSFIFPATLEGNSNTSSFVNRITL
jgi:hypothetical protein